MVEEVTAVQQDRALSDKEIKEKALQFMHQYEFNRRVQFYDHWLNRLGLDPVVKRLGEKRKRK